MSERSKWHDRRIANTALALGVLAVTVAGGCGVTADDEPRGIAADRLPEELATAPSTSEVPQVPGRQTVRMYFIGDDRLEVVHREVAERSPTALLRTLISGPIAAASPDVRTSIPAELEVRTQPVISPDGVITVDLTEEITSIEGARQKQAFAQMVYTLTELRGVTAVRFRVGEVDLAVPTDGGGSTQGPVGRRDFVSLAPMIDAPVTTTTADVP